MTSILTVLGVALRHMRSALISKDATKSNIFLSLMSAALFLVYNGTRLKTTQGVLDAETTEVVGFVGHVAEFEDSNFGCVVAVLARYADDFKCKRC